MGRPLLVRSGKGVRPTAYGRAVMEYAVIMRKAAEKIASLAVPEGENSLRLSAYPSRMIPRLMVEFYRAWGEDVHVEYRQGGVEEIVDHVHQGISELGVVFVAQKRLEVFQNIINYRRLCFLPRGTKRLCLYVGPEHPLYRAEQMDISQVPGLKLIRGVRDFFSVEHHLETVSVGAVDAQEAQPLGLYQQRPPGLQHAAAHGCVLPGRDGCLHPLRQPRDPPGAHSGCGRADAGGICLRPGGASVTPGQMDHGMH